MEFFNKNNGFLFTVIAFGLFLCSCGKTDGHEEAVSDPAVRFTTCLEEDLFSVDTKTTQVNSLSATGFNVVAVTGTPGSESLSWGPAAFSGPTVFTGGMYWPEESESNPGWVFYASNGTLSFASGGTTVAAANSTDIVVARKADAMPRHSNTLVFSHVFSRIGNVIVTEEDGYTISNVMIRITPKTGGNYNIRTGAWSNVVTGSATNISPSEPGMQTNDLYLVPGTYTLSASWHVEKGGYSEDFSNVQDDVTLEAGHLHVMEIVLGGNASSIIINLTLSPWTQMSLDFETGEYMSNVNIVAS